MSQGNDFANYPLDNADGGASEEVWFVAVASDDIKQMNVDQLDEAFRLGIITSATAVWTEGMEAWAPLGQVADLDGDSASGNDTDQGRSSAVAPSGSSGQEISQTLQSVGGGAGGGLGGTHNGGYGAVTMQSAQNSFLPGPSSVAPVTSSYAPSGSSYAPSSPFGLSTGPVALNVDEEAPPAQRGRRFRPERWALGAAAVIAIGVAVFNNLDLFSSSVASAGTQVPAPVAAAHPYDGADAVDRGSANSGSANSGSANSGSANSGGASKSDEAPSKAAALGDAPMAAPAAKAAPVPAEDAEPPASSKSKSSDSKSSDLKESFSKSFNKKVAAKSSKAAKPRKAAARATTKSRATKGKKPGVARSQSAFDPLNDSLP
jgi:hypothetical protein